jgi:3-deoxy-D-manno-octulosonic-acid transferase
MHKLYKIISYFLIPVIKINTFIRILNKKEDKIRYKERFGFTNLQKPLGKELIWIHASSVGEFKSSDFLINNFFNNYNILITTTTKTAADYAITNYGDKIIHQYAPYDITLWVNKFLDFWQPKFVVWIESDLWPNTIVKLRERGITSVFLNARISPKSFNKWKYFSSYYKFITKTFFAIYAQSQNDLKRIKRLTNNEVGYLGNLKLTKKFKKLSNSSISKNINIMIASTHHNEEDLIIPHIENISKKYPQINFFITPRHPERSKIIFELLQSKRLNVGLHSNIKNTKIQFLIIDSFGKMDEFYNKSDIVILGGSFTNNGGHNPIEAAVANCAIITGPHVYNWQNLYEDMIKKNCCLMIKNSKELEHNIINLIEDKSLISNLKNNALSFSESVFFNEDKLLSLINSKLEYNA